MGKRVVLTINETLTYERKVAVTVPDEMDESDFEGILSHAERGADTVDDIIYTLKRSGIQQNEPYDSAMDSPDRFEVECTEFYFSKDEKS